MRRPFCIVAILIAGPAAAENPPPVPPPTPPSPELLEFLGESAGEDPELILFMSTRAARQALKDAETKESKEDHDE